MMCRPIANRQNQFSPYGLAFPKAWARRSGVNPVWYLDITPGHDFLTRPINDLIEIAGLGEARAFVADGRSGKLLARVSAARSQVARLAPFIEMMGTYNGESPYRKEFWWEREWRKVGRLQFAWSNVVAVFAPESDFDVEILQGENPLEMFSQLVVPAIVARLSIGTETADQYGV